VRCAALPLALLAPAMFARALARSKRDGGAAALVLPHVLRHALVAATAHWLLDWPDAADALDGAWADTLRLARTALGWVPHDQRRR
jgi:hypothetical protein